MLDFRFCHLLSSTVTLSSSRGSVRSDRGLYIVATSILFKVNIFIAISILVPFFYFSYHTRNRLIYLLDISLICLLIIFYYTLFFSYMNNPWFEKDPLICDGPCFGWYGYERSIMLGHIKHVLLIISSSIITMIYRFFIKKSRS